MAEPPARRESLADELARDASAGRCAIAKLTPEMLCVAAA